MPKYRTRALAWMLALALGASLAPGPALGSDFEWIGKIEIDAQGLKSPDVKKRRAVTAELDRYDISLTAGYLLTALKDPDPEVRAAAGRTLAKHKVARAVPVVIDWLNEPDPAIKREAATILADIGTDEAVAALIRSLGDLDDTVRESAATALGKIGTPQVVVPLIGRLEDDKANVRLAAIHELAHIGDARAVIPLVGAFNDTHLEVRKAAILAVGKLGDPASIPALLRLLRDPADDIKQAAVTSLGDLNAIQATDTLIDELNQGSDDSYRSKVAYALGRIARRGQEGSAADQQAADRAVRALVQALALGKVRAAASEALRQAGPAAVPALVAHLDGEIESHLPTVIELLRDNGDARATDALVAELDRGRASQTLLLEALSQSGDSRALVPVLRLLSSTDAEVRMAAMNALRPMIGDGRAADILIGLLDDPSLEIRVLAAEYLGLMRARSAVPRLIELAGPGARPRLRLAAVDALGELADPRAAAVLLDILVRGPAELHQAAANALIYVGDESAVPRLMTVAADRETRSREHAVRALGGILRDRPDARARAMLEQFAQDESLRLGLAAIDALGAMADKTSVPALVKLAGQGSHRRRAALTALGNLGDAGALPVLLEALEASDDRVSGDAAWALAKLAAPGALDALVQATRRRGWATSINASAALARYAPRPYSDKLAALLYHRNLLVRANAAAGLGRMWAQAADRAPASVKDTLVLVLRKDPSWLVRAAAARALGRMKSARKALGEAESLDRDERVREAIKAALASPSALPGRTDWRAFHFVDPGREDAPVRQEPYFLIAADGLVTAFYTDARGMVTEEQFPPGEYTLEPRAKAARY